MLIALIQVKEEGWTGFFKGWQGPASLRKTLSINTLLLGFKFYLKYDILVNFLRLSGLRHNRIKNTNSKTKHIQMPCLVQTEALFDEDRGLSLQE